MNSLDPGIEDELVQRVLQGDDSALEEFLLRNYDWLERYIEDKIPVSKRSLVSAEDVLQEVYLKIFRSLGKYRPEGRPQLYAWLQTIARNTLFDELRKRKRHNVALEADVPAAASDQSGIHNLITELAIDDDPRASHHARAGELHQAFYDALATLSDEHRQVIELLYVQQQSPEVVAQQIGKSEDAIRGLAYRAKQRLRDEIVRLSRYI